MTCSAQSRDYQKQVNTLISVVVDELSSDQTEPDLLSSNITSSNENVYSQTYAFLHRVVVVSTWNTITNNPIADPDQPEKWRAMVEHTYTTIIQPILEQPTEQVLIPKLSTQVITQIIRIMNELADTVLHCDDALSWFYHYFQAWRRTTRSSSQKNLNQHIIANSIYTPQWMCAFLIDNSLGRYWIDRYPESGLFRQNQYTIPTKYQTSVRIKDRPLDQLRIIDPACGGGNFLLLLLRKLTEMYQERHSDWNMIDILSAILSNNLFGQDINDQAIELTIIAIYFLAIKLLVNTSDLTVSQANTQFSSIIDKYDNINCTGKYPYGWLAIGNHDQISPDTYDIIITNPPFGTPLRSEQTRLKQVYPDAYKDLISLFINQAINQLHEGGLIAMVTNTGLLALSKFSKFRQQILLEQVMIRHLIPLGLAALPDARTIPLLTILEARTPDDNATGLYLPMQQDASSEYPESYYQSLLTEAINTLRTRNIADTIWKTIQQSHFMILPRSRIDLTLQTNLAELYSWFQSRPRLDRTQLSTKEKLHSLGSQLARVYQGIATGNNQKYLRFWFEIPTNLIRLISSDATPTDLADQQPHYIPYSKGGGYIRYYNMNPYVLRWDEPTAERINKDGELRNMSLQGKADLHWSLISKPRARFCLSPRGMMTDVASMSIRVESEEFSRYALLAYLNSKLGTFFGRLQSQDRKWQVGNIARFPIPIDLLQNEQLDKLAVEAILLRKYWDSFNPVSPLFRITLIQKLISPNDQPIYQECHPFVDSYPKIKLSSINHLESLMELPDNRISTILLQAELIFDMLIARLAKLDQQIDSQILAKLSQTTQVGLNQYWTAHIEDRDPVFDPSKLVKDWLMIKVMEIVQSAPDGFQFNRIKQDGVIDQVQLYLETIAGDVESSYELSEEISSILGQSWMNWIEYGLFQYHCYRFGFRPILWQLQDERKTVSVFLDYHQISAVMFRTIKNALNLMSANDIDDLTTIASVEIRRQIDYRLDNDDIIPSPAKLAAQIGRSGKRLINQIAWIIEQSNVIMKEGYHPDRNYGVLPNLLPLAVASSDEVRSLLPAGTLDQIIRPRGKLLQLKY